MKVSVLFLFQHYQIIDNDEKKDEASTTTTYDPSRVFMAWLNDGLTQRPTTSSRKIRLSYSATSLDGKSQKLRFRVINVVFLILVSDDS